MKRVFVIAEAGVNHNADTDIAKKMIDAAVTAGADAVKFQTFIPEEGISIFAPKADYQKQTTQADESQLEMARKLQLDEQAHRILADYCNEKGILFLSSPFDIKSIDFLNSLGVDILKIPSPEIVNLPFLRKAGSLNKKIILSSGMADMREIKQALDILIEAGTKRDNITVLHCTTAYPADFAQANLKAMIAIKKEFNVEVGYSDHTPGIAVSIAAAALGACVIEKHFTMDKNLSGPDHKASLEPLELKQMIDSIRIIEKAMGDGIKKPMPSELKNKDIVRKSIVAARDITKGEVFSPENITVKRPANGISPMEWDEVIGKKANKDFKKDEIIKV